MNAVLLFVFLAPDASPQAVEAFKRLGGAWEVVEEQRNGQVVDPKAALLPPSVRFTTEKPKGIEKRCDIYTITLDPKADPPRLTATVAGGEIKGDRMLVIYRFDGDLLTLRLHYGAKDFPDGFRTANGDGTFVLKLRRIKR
jgi:uncharacterized protein (TIGR03067 family)